MKLYFGLNGTFFWLAVVAAKRQKKPTIFRINDLKHNLGNYLIWLMKVKEKSNGKIVLYISAKMLFFLSKLA